MSALSVARAAGGVISARGLRARGIAPGEISSAVRSGALRRARRGWYHAREAPADVVRAITAGGALTCVSALSLQGIWTMPDPHLHVRIARGVKVTPARDLRIHWSDTRQDHRFPMDSAAAALEFAIHCIDTRASVVAIDSMMNQGRLSSDQLMRLGSSPRGRRLLALADGRAQSGLETIARLALRRHRVRLDLQRKIADVGNVDLLIGDRLVLELDGESWHDRAGDFENDRRRDRILVERGYRVMRASYRQVMTDWPGIEQQLLALIRRDEHLWPRRRG